jgi:thioester reductase-like protein
MIYALIKGCFQLELFPSLDPSIDLVPVDFVADALVHIALQPDSTGKAYHLNNPEPTNQAKAYGWIRDQGYRFDVVPYEEWRHRLLTHPDVASNALYPFVGLFEDFEADNLRFPRFDSSNTKEKLAGSDISCVSTFDMFPVMFGYFQQSGFLPLPPGRG